MSDLPPNDPPCGWVRLYHPRGVWVTLPVPIDGTPCNYATAFAAVDSALAAGWLTAPPGLEEGEERELVGYVVRLNHAGPGGQLTPVLDLYDTQANHVWPFLRVYLDNPTMIEAFEFATGLKLDRLPEYVGEGRIDRGKPQTQKLVTQLRKPVGVVFTPNPNYDPNETDVSKKKPKNIFARWVDEKPAAPVRGTASASGSGVSASASAEDIDAANAILDDAARQKYAAATSFGELKAAFESQPRHVQERTKDDATKRRKELEKTEPIDRENLAQRSRAAAKSLKLSEGDAILKFSVQLKVDPQRVPQLNKLTDEQLKTLCRLLENQVQLNTLTH